MNSEVQLCLLNYFCITNWCLPSLVLQLVLAAKIALCIVSSIIVIQDNTRDSHAGFISENKLIYSLNGFQCVQEKENEAFQSHLPVCLTNMRNFLCISPRTSKCHLTLRSFQYLYLIVDGAKWTLAICPAEHLKWDKLLVFKMSCMIKKTYCFWNILCPTLIVASGAQIRTLCSGLVLFLTFDYGARIEGIVTHVLLCETLYRV